MGGPIDELRVILERESLWHLYAGARIDQIEATLNRVSLPWRNGAVQRLRFAEPIDAPIANLAVLLESLKGTDDGFDVIDADPAPLGLALSRDAIVQLNQVNPIKSKALETAFDGCNHGIFNKIHLLGQ